MKSRINFGIILSLLLCLLSCTRQTDNGKVVIAYIGSHNDVIPDPTLVTHVNYAFGDVKKTFDGIDVENPGHLKEISRLKKEWPELKVLLSVGGWESGNFSEMAASDEFRLAFANDCRRVMDEFNLDGIDIDWEFPSSSMSGISSSPDDIENFTYLLRDIRKAIGKKALLTIAVPGTDIYYDFPGFIDYLDFVNVMCYDMGFGAKPHNALFKSERVDGATSSSSMKVILDAGVPKEKIVMGIPFYGRGVKEYSEFICFNRMYPIKPGYNECWDDAAKVPYITDSEGNFVFGFETPESAAYKCDFILEQDFRGAMYWEYSYDSSGLELSKVVARKILGN